MVYQEMKVISKITNWYDMRNVRILCEERLHVQKKLKHSEFNKRQEAFFCAINKSELNNFSIDNCDYKKYLSIKLLSNERNRSFAFICFRLHCAFLCIFSMNLVRSESTTEMPFTLSNPYMYCFILRLYKSVRFSSIELSTDIATLNGSVLFATTFVAFPLIEHISF